jgi:Metallopeptidase family M24
MQAELMPLCGNQEVQVQMTVALDPLDDISKKCERVARAAYEAGIKAMKPGMTFAELLAIMEEPLKTAGCWGYTPLVHSLGPHFLAGRTLVNRDQIDRNVRYAGSNAARRVKLCCSRAWCLPSSPMRASATIASISAARWW